MFVETNEIKGLIINLDSLLEIDGRRCADRQLLRRHDADASLVTLNEEMNKALAEITNLVPVRLVSSLGEARFRLIARQTGIDQFNVEALCASNTIEEFILIPQMTCAINSLGVHSSECVYLCGDHNTISQAQTLRLGTICWWSQSLNSEEGRALLYQGPDFLVAESKMLVDVLAGRFLGYRAEVDCTPDNFFARSHGDRYVRRIKFPNPDFHSFPISVTGRYFRRSDPRWQKHALSLRIYNSKNNMERHQRLFAGILGREIIKEVGDEYDVVTRVPPKPSETQDRLLSILDTLPTLDLRGQKIDTTKIDAALLRCVRDFHPQKETAYENKRGNVRGAFAVTRELDGESVVVIDDVTTSGSTLAEITDILVQAGASRVLPVALAYHPGNLNSPEEVLSCPNCGADLVPRHNRRDGQPFFACSSHFDSGCSATMTFAQGVRLLNNRIQVDQLGTVEDVDF